MGKLTDIIKGNTKTGGKFSELTGLTPSPVKRKGVDDQDFIKDIVSKSPSALRTTSKFPIPNLAEINRQKLDEVQLQASLLPKRDAEGNVLLDMSQYEALSPEQRQRVTAVQEDRSRLSDLETERLRKEKVEADKPWYKKALEDPKLSKIFGGLLLSKLAPGAPAAGTSVLGTKTGQEFAAGAATSIPLAGELFKPSAQTVREQSELPRTTVDLPLVGDVSIDPTTAGALTGGIGFTAAQYGAVNKLLSGVGTGSKLGQLLSKSKIGKVATTQAADLLADVIVQTPSEFVNALAEEKSLDQFSKDWLNNRKWDIIFNAVVGGTMELAKLKSLKSAAKKEQRAVQDALSKVSPEQAKQIRDTLDIKVDVPLSPRTASPEAFKSLDDKALRDQRLLKALESAKKQGIELPIGFEEGIRKEIGSLEPRAFLDGIQIPKVEPTKSTFSDMTGIKPSPQVEINQKFNAEQAKADVQGSPRVSDFEEPTVGKSKSQFAQRVKNLFADDPTTAQFKKRLEELELSTTSNEARTLAARQVVDEDLETALKIVKEGDRFGSAIESEMGNAVVDVLNKQGRNAEAVEVISKMSEKFRSAGKDVQAASIWSKTSPSGMQKWATDTLQKADVKVDPKLISEVGNDMKTIQDLSVDELAEIVAKRAGGNVDKVKNSILNSFSYDQLKAVNTAITMNKVISRIPVLKARKLSSLQAMSHLLNAKTFNRNILGNAASLMGEALSKYPASIADRVLSFMTGQRSVTANMPAFKKSLLEGWNQGKRSFFEIKAGVGKGKTGKYEALFGDTFKSKIGKGGERLMSWSLQTPDEFFKGFAKADSLYNQLHARLGKDVKKMSFDDIMKKATPIEIDTAVKEAEFMTFQNDSFLAEVLSKSKKGLNSLSTGLASRIPGAKQLFTKDFGLGDMVIKYTRVPGNIMTRGFEYSPLGYLKAGEGIFNMMKNLDSFTPQQQRELALIIGRATTGTGLFFLGKFLNEKGIITDVSTGTDYNAQAFERAEGLGDYKINLDALSRLIRGEDPTRQAGDTLKSFNWAAPMVTPIGVGARMADSKLGPGTFLELGVNTVEESMDLPSLFIAKQMMFESMKEGSNPYDVASVPLKEAIPGFVPSTVRQVAQTIDPTIRESSGGATGILGDVLNPLLGEKSAGKIQANIPLLSKKLPPKLDVLGREQSRTPGILPNLIDPATTTTFTPTAFGDKIRLVEQITGESNFFPDRKAPNRITFNGEKLTLTPEEKVAWQRAEGQMVDELYTDFLEGVDIDESNAAFIAKRLSKLKSIASKLAKQEFLANRFGGN